MENTTESKFEPLAMRFSKAQEVSGLSHWTLRKEAKAGRLKVIRRGRCVLIPYESLKAYLTDPSR